MTLPKDSGLYIFDIVAYGPLAPVSIYLLIKHGSRGALGFFYLNMACGIRIVADILTLTSSSGNPTIANAIVSSIGLSPLMLALAGMIHEAHVYLLQASSTNGRSEKRMRKWLWMAQLQIHGAVIAGMVLIIIGTVNLESANPASLTTAETKSDNKLRSAGSIVLLVVWIIQLQYALFLAVWARKSAVSYSTIHLSTMLLPAAVFIGLRVAYSVAYIFDHKDSQLNPLTGALWVKVVFMVLAPLFAVISMVVGGWRSRHVKNEPAFRNRSEGVSCEEIRMK